MYKLLPLVEKLIVTSTKNVSQPITMSNKIRNWLLAFSGVTLLSTVLFGLYSLYLWLDSNFSQIETMAYMGAATFLISLISLSMIFLMFYLKIRKLKKLKHKVAATIEDSIIIAEQELGEPIFKNPKSAVALASTAGFLLGERIL